MKAAAAVAALDVYTIDYIHSQMTVQLTTYTMYTLTLTSGNKVVTLVTMVTLVTEKNYRIYYLFKIH